MEKNGHQPVFLFFVVCCFYILIKDQGRIQENLEMNHTMARRIRELSEPLCESQGLELVHVEYQREPRGFVMRFYIDRSGGVTLADCAAFSRQVGDLLDVALDIAGKYTLEVSSPGSERPLGRLGDFKRFEGSMARIRTLEALDGQKNFTGRLAGVTEDTVILNTRSGSLRIPCDLISRARLVHNNGVPSC